MFSLIMLVQCAQKLKKNIYFELKQVKFHCKCKRNYSSYSYCLVQRMVFRSLNFFAYIKLYQMNVPV